MKCSIIAEIGINHNGDLNLAKKLIDLASLAGCDYVKFQKRTPDLCVPEHQKSKRRDTPWGEMSYIDYKRRVEFEEEQYNEIDDYCKLKKVNWFASAWDKPSVDFLSKYSGMVKIPSALISDTELVRYARSKNDFVMISTGMSTESEVENAVECCDADLIFHTNSTYPSPPEDLNLGYISWLQNKYPEKQIGYSGHEYGLVTTWATIAMGVSWIERHLTLDRSMWGSDHLSSVEPVGLFKLVRGIRDIESALSSGNSPRVLLKGEDAKKSSLRK